ncbi:related to Protein ROT1 [Saccharomycodes ludwigii]|uniref:Protein ROT1 n=1 Tax=Saccharomycodes ludwigii TaxID=36035 RepID=A0A376B2D9_9ASCO|nr:related to Protein ROT1 [Saccharomycodes ludwigii]
MFSIITLLSLYLSFHITTVKSDDTATTSEDDSQSSSTASASATATISTKEQEFMNSLEGTWSSKSHQVFTGSGFYDPVDELIFEPSLPGISYSFTADGHFEQALYRVTSNPKKPACPIAVITFQHGSYEVLDNGTVILNPIEIDGRQLVSDPCNDNGTSSYTRFNSTTVFKWFTVELNTYHGIQELQLYQYDWSALQPLYLVYKPPLMLPTITLNPVSEGTQSVTVSSKKKKRDSFIGNNLNVRERVRRYLENKHKTNAKKLINKNELFDSSYLWWIASLCICVGSVLFLSA